MDEDFEYFLEKFGPAIDRRDVPPSSLERYRSRLPDQLLTYWKEHGWCGYAEGLFWTVDPQEYEPAVSAWLGHTQIAAQDTYHLIARSAFGDMFFFGERLGIKLHVVAADATMLSPRPGTTDPDLRIRAFFGSLSQAACDFSDINGERLFSRALEKQGRLKNDEMYGFVPALAIGGRASLDHLQKVNAVEHLTMLAQLSELRVFAGSG